MITTKKFMLGCAFAVTMVSGSAFAVTEVNVADTVAAAGAEPTVITVDVDGYSGYVKSQFNFSRSRNVAISSVGNAAGTGVAIATQSIKGRNTFFANSNGASAKDCPGLKGVGPAKPTMHTAVAADTEAVPGVCQ